MWQSVETLNVFNTLALKHIFWKTKTFFKNSSFASNYFNFLKSLFQFKNHRKRSFNRGCFFPVSTLNESWGSFLETQFSKYDRFIMDFLKTLAIAHDLHEHLFSLRIDWRLIFGNVIRCSTLRLWIGSFINFKSTPVFF